VNRYSLTHLTDSILLHDLKALVAQDRATTGTLLAHLAEVDARKLYLPAAHPSMYSYCVHELRLSEDAAFKRIQAARTARLFPVIFAALADGRLHLAAVCLLAPHLTPDNADELLTAAAHQSKAGLEQLLARRFPRPDVPAQVQPLSPALTLDAGQPPPGVVAQLAPGQVEPHAPGPVEAPAPRPTVAALAPQRFALQLTIGQGTYEKLQYAQALLGHQLAPSDLPTLLDRALDALIGQLERRKFAATSRPRRRRPSADARHVPAAVRREGPACGGCPERDGGQCTFVSAAGRRCPARSRLEFDHVEPVARGGRATVGQVRLLCRAHNEHAAECAFGAGFMSQKREAAQQAAEEKRLRAAAAERERARAAAAAAEARARAAEEARVRAAAEEVVPWLRALGLRADEARQAAARCEAIPEAPLEERVRCALSCYARPARGRAVPIPRLLTRPTNAAVRAGVRNEAAIEVAISSHMNPG